ncbi:MAG: glycogen synthase GlgA [Thermodesulfobacteriota bacterium]
MSEPLKVLFLSPEAEPFAKTGGLADAAGALPCALKRLGVDVRLLLPLYRAVKEGGFEMRTLLSGLEVPLGSDMLCADVEETRTEDGIPVYLIRREDMYDRPNLYGDSAGDYYDNLERFSFLCHASLRIAEALSLRPDLIHCHDWQTGLVPALLRGTYRHSEMLGRVPCVFTIHNLGYQGLFPARKFPVTGLQWREFFHPDGVEYWGNISLLKAGIMFCDAVTTVSPAYAREIQSPEFGMGMEGILFRRRASLHGILNGVDYGRWDPAKDPHLPARYFPGRMGGKAVCKESLVREMGLEPTLVERPLLGMVSRLTSQKGVDLLVRVMDELLRLDVGVVILGSGERHYEEKLREAERSHPGRLGLMIGFDEPLAHRIVAGADILLVPSRYEPCGLIQMYALKYGTVPLVRATGGLEDSVREYDLRSKEGNGLKFGPYEPEALLAAVRRGVALFRYPQHWRRLVLNGMKEDFSWDRSARSYLELYESLREG